jgi:uncharacterized glyoxalase superfamily metalloenzyme YdcJ
MRTILFLFAAASLLACASPKATLQSWEDQEDKFSFNVVKGFGSYLKFQETGDSLYYHRTRVHNRLAAEAYMEQQDINTRLPKRLRKPNPGIFKKAMDLMEKMSVHE